MKERLIMLIEALNLNTSSFSKLIGAPEATTRMYLDRGSKPKSDYLEKVVRSIENLNAEWLLTGDGNMFNPAKNIQEFSSNWEKRHEIQTVPLYNITAAAGLIHLFNSQQHIIDYITIPNLPKSDGAVYVAGDSMYPLLKNGDIVIYRSAHKQEIIFGEMYVLDWEKYNGDIDTMVKFVQKSELGKEYVKLVSENRHWDPIDVHIDKIKSLGTVKASIRINSMS